MNLSEMIALAIERKPGNKEFALFSECGDQNTGKWEAHIGNPSRYVQLGEVPGHIVGVGETPELALQKLLDTMGKGVKGCFKRLAPRQHWSYCGEIDMGQTGPALCVDCGGTYVVE